MTRVAVFELRIHTQWTWSAVLVLFLVAPSFSGPLSVLPLKSKLVYTVLGLWFTQIQTTKMTTMTPPTVISSLPPGSKTSHEIKAAITCPIIMGQ